MLKASPPLGVFRLLVVGAGYLGQEIARMAQEGGWEVCPVVRTGESADGLRGKFPTVQIADAVGEDFWNQLSGRWDGMIWAMAPSRKGVGHEFEAMHRGGAVRAAGWAGAGKVPMVYLSSTSVYAEAGGGWVDETSAVAEEDSRAMAMVTAERATLRAGGSVVRCAGIYGPGRQLRPDVGGPERWLNVIQVEDAARAVGAVLRNGGEIFNVCEDEALARGQKGGVWAENSLRSRRSKRVRNQKLKEAGWNAVYAAGRSKN